MPLYVKESIFPDNVYGPAVLLKVKPLIKAIDVSFVIANPVAPLKYSAS